MTEYTQEWLDNQIKEREKQRQQKEAESKKEMIKANAKAAWLAQQGTEEEFEHAWRTGLERTFSEEINRAMAAETVEADKAARRNMRRTSSI